MSTVSRENEGDVVKTVLLLTSKFLTQMNMKYFTSWNPPLPPTQNTLSEGKEEMHLNAFITYHGNYGWSPKHKDQVDRIYQTHLPIDREWFLHGHTVDYLDG